jgi:LysR family hydrogen peroxide-inducible transcriptional activator
MQIQKIEEELSILIFDRSKPIQLTDIGQKIVNQAKTCSWTDIVEQQKDL